MFNITQQDEINWYRYPIYLMEKSYKKNSFRSLLTYRELFLNLISDLDFEDQEEYKDEIKKIKKKEVKNIPDWLELCHSVIDLFGVRESERETALSAIKISLNNIEQTVADRKVVSFIQKQGIILMLNNLPGLQLKVKKLIEQEIDNDLDFIAMVTTAIIMES